MYLRSYTFNDETKSKKRRIVYRSRDKSDEIQRKPNEGGNEQESTENLESNFDPNDSGSAALSCCTGTQIADTSRKEEYESEIHKLKMELQEKEQEIRELIIEKDKVIQELTSKPNFGINSIKNSDA